MATTPLDASRLRPACDPAALEFETTADLKPLDDFFGQPRARDALDFGIGIRHSGYNLFALGPAGIGKQTLVREFINERAAAEPAPSDWCYVNNFDDWRKPQALELPAGRGTAFARDVAGVVEEVGQALKAVFESEEYRNRAEAIEQGLSEQHEQATERVQEKAREKGLVLLRTPGGITLAPTRDGQTLSPKEFRQLSTEEQERIQANIEELQEEMRRTFRQAPQWQKETREKIDALNEEMARGAVAPPFEEIRERNRDLAEVVAFLARVEQDVVEHFRQFLPQEASELPFAAALLGGGASEDMPFTNRYVVNVLVERAGGDGAPVVFADHPIYNNLIGRIEHRAVQGTLVTDFTMIRAGALHRANGGYLLLDAVKVLTEPFAWDALKRALTGAEIKIESLGESLSLISTAALEPEAIPLKVKIVLLGEPVVYYLLSHLDPEFADLFKVQVEFDDRMDRDAANEQLYARMIAAIAANAGLPPFDRGGVARVIDYGMRLVDDNEKLGTHLRSLSDLISESAFWAERRGTDRVGAEDVKRAIDAKIERSDRVRERIHEEIRRGTILIDTAGEKVGQVNALSVLMLGGFSFGKPSRVTARARLGKGQVVDIEREVEMGGPIHSKGVLILSHFLGAHYALDAPLSLSASLVFEQSYGGVDGDSASCAELCALLSALAEVPIRQSLAITGSINQGGEVQAIGGVNDKIEGFFDVCRARGFDGAQGVLIPAANVKHLMLREDVAAAADDGSFAVYPVAHVAEAIELLTGMPAGERGADGQFPPDTVNERVERRLREFSQRMRDFARPKTPGEAPS